MTVTMLRLALAIVVALFGLTVLHYFSGDPVDKDLGQAMIKGVSAHDASISVSMNQPDPDEGDEEIDDQTDDESDDNWRGTTTTTIKDEDKINKDNSDDENSDLKNQGDEEENQEEDEEEY